MKVLILATDAFGGYGGIAQYNRDFANALSLRPSVSEIEILVRIADENASTNDNRIVQSPPNIGRLNYAIRAFGRAIKFRPDVIVSGHLYHGSLALMLARLTGAKLVSQLHGTEIWGNIRALHLYPIERSDLVFCVSTDTQQHLLKHSRVDPQKVVILNNTVQDCFFPGEKQVARAKFSIRDEEFIILTVARLDDRGGYKGHDRIISLLARMRDAFEYPLRYVIAGTGKDELRLKELSQKFGVGDIVTFLGRVPTDDLPDLYRSADLFALPSTGEGFGIVYLEAMACGTPSIGLNVGGAPDALGNGALGFCVNEADFPDALFEAVREPGLSGWSLHDKIQHKFGAQKFSKKLSAFWDVL